MKTKTSSLMDGKDYQQRKVMRIDDINAMADADIRENERLEKLAEEEYPIFDGDLLGIAHNQKHSRIDFIKGYNKAKETLYTEFDIIKAFEHGWNQRHYGIDDEILLREIQNNLIKSLKQPDEL